jgi:hypothetical protein
MRNVVVENVYILWIDYEIFPLLGLVMEQPYTSFFMRGASATFILS